ncbi:MAG: tetratricopeptide repeat protein [Bacteroidetes bacterium]|nr:MAG: tetratricopeptide repeat protein [Bacteroidota bacterium]
MRLVLICLIVVLQGSHNVFGQNTTVNPTDSLVSLAISQSEKALFDARFEDAKETVKLSLFNRLQDYTFEHEILLTIQHIRIDRFSNIVYLKTTDNKTNLQNLRKFLPDTSRVEHKEVLSQYFLALSNAYRTNGIRDTSALYREKALLLFQKEKNYEKIAEIRALIISLTHNHHFQQGDKNQILELIPKYEEEIAFSQLHSKYVLSYNTRHLAQIYRRQTFEYDNALSLFERSLELRLELGFKPFLPASYSSLGDVYMKMNEDKLAIKMYTKAFKLAEKIGFVRYQSYPIMQIGDIYFNQQKIKKAHKYYLKALKLAKENNYSVGVDQCRERIKKVHIIKN